MVPTCRGSYGVSPTTPPVQTAPTIGLWRVLSLRHFRPARSGSCRLAREHRAARRQQSDPLAPAIGCQLKHHRQWSRTDTLRNLGRRSDISAGAIGLLSVGKGASSGASPAERAAGAGDRLPAETPPTMVAHRNCYRIWAALTSSLRFLARARGVGTTTSPAERAADAAPSDTRAANQTLDIEAGGGVLDIEAGDLSTSFFVCSISFVLFLLVAAD